MGKDGQERNWSRQLTDSWWEWHVTQGPVLLVVFLQQGLILVLERLGERIVVDLQFDYLRVLVGGDCDEHSLRKLQDHRLRAISGRDYNLHDVLVHRVEQNLKMFEER